MAYIAVEGLSFTYPQAHAKALDAVSLRVDAGEYVTLCGKSGCGKTTLLRQLKPALRPHGSIEGRVLLGGTPVDELDQRAQAARIGFVMQDPDAQIVTDKVWHELAFGLESLGCDEHAMRVRVAEMASYFGIQNWFHRDVRELSGGEKQLVNLASIMAMQPDVLVLDEPTSQLDPIAAGDFLNAVGKINRELGTTIILGEHRLEEAFTAATRVVVLDEGRVVADGAPREVADKLHASGNDMAAALPAPARAYYGVGVRRDGGCPLTVREGRAWLSEFAAASGLSAPLAPGRPDAGGVEGAGTAAEAEPADAAVELDRLWLRYGREDPDVLRGASLRVAAGSFHAVVGGNGTGKSTLLRAICGVERPYRGTVRVLGRKLKDWKGAGLFDGALAMLPQDPADIFVRKTVRADLAEMLDGLDGDVRDAGLSAAVAETGIAHLLERHPFDLSGGELQRAALAKVLLADPRVVLLDEPTKGIDAFFKRRLAELVAGLTARGVTVVMVSHDVEFVARYADRVSMLFDGCVVATDTPRRFFAANSFYTTAANRMSRHVFADAVTVEDVIGLCRGR